LAYNVKICEINSAGLVERTISAFQNREQGADYLFQKLQQVYLAP
jgi:hypothetical protein